MAGMVMPGYWFIAIGLLLMILSFVPRLGGAFYLGLPLMFGGCVFVWAPHIGLVAP
jgi:hypothetical protein